MLLDVRCLLIVACVVSLFVFDCYWLVFFFYVVLRVVVCCLLVVVYCRLLAGVVCCVVLCSLGAARCLLFCKCLFCVCCLWLRVV